MRAIETTTYETETLVIVTLDPRSERVEVRAEKGRFGEEGWTAARVNWSSIGSVSPATAASYARLIARAAEIAVELDSQHGVVTVGTGVFAIDGPGGVRKYGEVISVAAGRGAVCVVRFEDGTEEGFQVRSLLPRVEGTPPTAIGIYLVGAAS